MTTGTGGVAAAERPSATMARLLSIEIQDNLAIFPSFLSFFFLFFFFFFFFFFFSSRVTTARGHRRPDLLLLLAAVRMVYAVTAVLARTLLAQNIANGPRTSSVRVNIVKSFSLFHFLFVSRAGLIPFLPCKSFRVIVSSIW